MQPQAVIFDIGNVLVEWHPEQFYDARIGTAQRERFFAEVPIHPANLAIDAGAPFRATIMALADAHPDWATEIRWWHDDWAQMLAPVIEPSVALLRALRGKDVPVFALTNWGSETFFMARSMFDFFSAFHRTYVSGDLGVIKPNAGIYEILENDCGIAPQGLLFVDDRASNIVAAARRGWRTHQFESWQGWARRLVAEGLLTRMEAGL